MSSETKSLSCDFNSFQNGFKTYLTCREMVSDSIFLTTFKSLFLSVFYSKIIILIVIHKLGKQWI